MLAGAEDICDVARRFVDVRDFFFVGRGSGHAVALEAPRAAGTTVPVSVLLVVELELAYADGVALAGAGFG